MTAPVRVDARETDAQRLARIRGNLQRLREAGAPDEAIQQYVQMEQVTPEQELAAMPRTLGEDLAGGVQAAVQGLTFNFGDEIAGGLEGIFTDKTIGEGIADQRASLEGFREAHPKTALGLELTGALGSGLGAAGAAKAGAFGLSRLAPVARLAATGVGGGALAGYGSGEGGVLSGERATRGAVGGALGGAVGYGLGKLATSRAGDAIARRGRSLMDFLAEQGGNSGQGVAQMTAREGAQEAVDPVTQAATRSIYERMGRDVGELPQARTILDELKAAGMGDDVMAADVLPGGPRELRRASNISPRGEELARQRVGERGAQVGVRARRALTEATGLPEQTTSAGVDDLVAHRAAKADPLYAQARAEGLANRTTPRTPEVEAFLREPDVAGIVEELSRTRKFRGLSPDDPEMLDAIYKVFSDRQAKVGASQLANPRNVGRFETENIRSAKDQALEAISGPRGPMPSYRTAVEDFAESSALKDAYESGVALFNKPVGDIRAAMQAMKPDEAELFKRGVFDALIEKRVAPISPNPDLGDVARMSKRAGQATLDTQAAADRLREVFGEEQYQQLLRVAQAEGRFSRTASEAVGNSTTAKQLQDMGLFGSMAQDAGSSFSPSPAWWGARAVRSMARRGGDEWAKRFNEPANRRAVEMLTERGEQPVTSLMELLEQLGQADAARAAAARPVGAAVTRTGVSQF